MLSKKVKKKTVAKKKAQNKDVHFDKASDTKLKLRNRVQRTAILTDSSEATKGPNDVVVHYVVGKLLRKQLKEDKVSSKAYSSLKALDKGLDWYKSFVTIT